MYNTKAEAVACLKGDVCLVEDQETGLIYNQTFCPDLVIYDTNYQNEQAVSQAFQRHLLSVAQIIQETMGNQQLVEVGCGKGFFLEMLLERGVDIIGFDPTYEGANPRIKQSYFELHSTIEANGIIIRHVLEHIQDPFNFLMAL
jgi:2-polyprenyl-3-methyl-5-hydroxy-6-metoxy-1,4-benzoquinol methylase